MTSPDEFSKIIELLDIHKAQMLDVGGLEKYPDIDRVQSFLAILNYEMEKLVYERFSIQGIKLDNLE